MANEIKTKKTFGSCDVANISPGPVTGAPKKINMTISFEDALRLHLSLGQALAKLNTYNQATTAGKRAAVLVCLHQDLMRVSVLEGQLPKKA